jgi:formamidopyrimidine-DNA glycosylase
VPELPEVQTTVNGLNKVLPKLTIKDVWSDYFVGTTSKRTDNIKNKKYFDYFKKETIGEKFKNAERKGKNILIHLTNNKTILIHMKMTGHLLYGTYGKLKVKSEKFENKYVEKWEAVEPETLKDPFSRFIHLIFILSNKKHLAFSDMRKFAKVHLLETQKINSNKDLIKIGPDPLKELDSENLEQRLNKKPNGKIKTILMDQEIIAGIGNIYSDEILWQAGIHPERMVKNLTKKEINLIFKASVEILNKSIKMGGDSMSDYRNIHGQKGSFQNAHKVYRRTKQKCLKRGCVGEIKRKIIGGRSSHFCDIHQK